MSKNLNLIAIIAFSMSMFSCKKEKQNLITEVSPPYEQLIDGKFTKELMITSENGKSTVFMNITSEDKASVDEFLSIHELYVRSESTDINELISENQKNSYKKSEDSIVKDINVKKMVTFEIIASNIEEGKNNFSIEVKTKENSSKKSGLRTTDDVFQPVYGTRWETTEGFLGVVNYIDNYDLQVRRGMLHYWYTIGWTEDQIYTRVTNETYNPYLPYFAWVCRPSDYYKMSLTVIPDQRAGYYNPTQYKIVYNISDFRGRQCSNKLNTFFDGRNCFLGAAPTGTNAFMYPTNTGNFYYTPVNGNQCPSPGSYFDGANCFVAKIPSTTKGFVYDNKWYVLPELINYNANTGLPGITCY